MTRYLDYLLDRITMYRLALYYLIGLVVGAVLLSTAGILHVDPFALLFTTAFLVAACSITNWIFAKAYGVPANTESVYITALILALIVAPLRSYQDLWFLGWAAVWAMASKYIVAINGKHLFNPAAFAVALTYFTLNQSATWWVGSAAMLPLVTLGGVLIVRKTRRADVVWTFLFAAVAAVIFLGALSREDFSIALQRLVFDSPLLFFAFIFLTEPLTMPATHLERLFYGAVVGILFVPEFHVGSFYVTPELAIMLGNLYAYLVSPKTHLLLTLKEKIQVAPDIYDFIFEPSRQFAFVPGQYMEWTLAHADPDSRGNRRYFTLASSPTEATVRLGVKFYENSSTLKQSLLEMRPHDEILATQLAGDFVLPQNPRQKCVFIAGGIGITPFRSMIQYLLDTRQWRPIAVFYVNKTARDIVYKNVLDRAQLTLGIKTIYTVTDNQGVPSGWNGKTGRLSPEMIKAEVLDYGGCLYYISGPRAMVDSSKEMLRSMGVREDHIKTDYFTGLT